MNYNVLQDILTQKSELHVLEVPHGGEFLVELEDGSKIWVNAESNLEYLVPFAGKERRVKLSGEAYFQVAKADIPFIVEFNAYEIKVLGTEFNVKAYKDNETTVATLVNGQISLIVHGDSCTLYPVSYTHLVYTGYYNWGFIWVKAGRVDFSLTTSEKYPNAERLKAVGYSLPSWDWIFTIRDTLISHFDKNTFMPYEFSRKAHEGNYHKTFDYTFHYDDSVVLGDIHRIGKFRRTDTVKLLGLSLIHISFYSDSGFYTVRPVR